MKHLFVWIKRKAVKATKEMQSAEALLALESPLCCPSPLKEMKNEE
jgi:hypothetical protein